MTDQELMKIAEEQVDWIREAGDRRTARTKLLSVLLEVRRQIEFDPPEEIIEIDEDGTVRR